MASSALIKVKIQRNLNAKPKSEGTTATNGATESSKETQALGDGDQVNQNDKRKEKGMKKTTNRFEPYNPQRRYRAFISNIPFDVKWQALKDLVKEKVGEVTYVELLMDDEGKSRGCAAVEFKLEDSMKKAVQVLNKHVLNGRPLKVRELDYSVGWKKLKEVFGIAGTVVRADVLEDKDGKSRGIGTVTYEQPIEAVQAISMFNGQPLFDRPMMVKMDDKSMPKGDLFPADRPPQLPRGLGGIGMGLGPGGQPIDANHLRGSTMGGPGGMSMDSMGFGMNKMGIDGPPVGGNSSLGSINRFPSGMGIGRMSGDIDRAMSAGFDRSELGSLSRGYGDSLDRGIGSGAGNLVTGIDRLSSGLGRGVDRVASDIDRMGLVMDRLGPSADRLGSGIGSGMGSLGMDHISSSIDRIVASSLDRMSTGIGYGVDRMGSSIDRVGSTIDRMGSSLDRIGSGMDRVGVGIDRLGSSSMDRMGSGLDRMGPMMDRLPSVERLSAGSMNRVGLDHMASSPLDRMGPGIGMGSSMGLGMGASFDRPMDIDHTKFGNNFGGSFGGTAGVRPAAVPRKGCQIFVRNLSFDCTWKMLKDQFSECGHVVYADIKTENGKSKGCGVVRFESPEVAERACRMMNGAKLGGREIDVRMDRNA
eukprot:XP_017952023.1 PREDICTED: heterogeneous nuclear ribonucleoprotein M isoform X4 [Xenopus tropicalis]